MTSWAVSAFALLSGVRNNHRGLGFVRAATKICTSWGCPPKIVQVADLAFRKPRWSCGTSSARLVKKTQLRGGSSNKKYGFENTSLVMALPIVQTMVRFLRSMHRGKVGNSTLPRTKGHSTSCTHVDHPASRVLVPRSSAGLE